MSKEVTSKSKSSNKNAPAKVNASKRSAKRPLRTATFRTEVVKGAKIFRPVNKRAHKWALKVGKRTRITEADLRNILDSGKVKVAVYLTSGTLKAVK